MPSLLDPTSDPASYSDPNSFSLLTTPSGGSDSPPDASSFLDYITGRIGDENLRAIGADPDTIRMQQGMLAERPELRLPQLPNPAAGAGGTADPYTPTMDPQSVIDAANRQFGINLGMQIGGSFEGGLKVPTRAGNIVRVDVRAPDGSLIDAKPMTGKAVGSLLDAHLADPANIGLYGGGTGPGGQGADYTVTLPPQVSRAGDITAEAQRMVDEAASQPAARTWYSGGAEAMHGLTGEDLPATQRLVAAHAATSPQTDVAGNANFAVNAWNQSLLGQPIAVSSGQKNAALEQILYGDVLPSSRKVGPFYENHMRYLDPDVGNNLTNDIWQMRQAGFTNPDGTPYSGTPSIGEDNYVRLQVQRATNQLNDQAIDGGGWTPDQVQAALWVHAKDQAQGGGGTPGVFNFKNGLERLTAAQTQAHAAGPALLGGFDADPAAQGDFHAAANPILTDGLGRDLVNSSLGMLTPPGVPGGAAVAMTADGIKPASRTLMDASTLIRATLLRQPDALWTSSVDTKGLPTIANSNAVHVFSGDPAESLPQVKAALTSAGGGLENAVLLPSPAGVRVLNVNELTGLDNPTFQGAVKDAISGAGLQADLQRGRADYGYFTHDWNADPTGSGYVAQLGRLPAHLGRIGDQLFANLGPQLDAAGSQISGRAAGAGGLPGGSGPWRAPGFAQAVGPPQPLTPLRPWLQRPSPTDQPSALLSLLRGAP